MGVAERGASTERSGPRTAIGRPVDELETPALVLDLAMASRNIAFMAERFAELPASLRPHIKAHKCAELAREQLEHGAIGVTTATAAEAGAMAAAGIPDILVANEVVDPGGIDRLTDAALSARVTVAVDDATNLAALADRAQTKGAVLGIVVEFDVGMGRGGARSAAAAVALGRAAADLAGVELEGLFGYEGHCASEPDLSTRNREARASMERLLEVADRFRAEGLPVRIVSAGATGTYATTGSMPGITEVQAGTYVLMDRFHEPLATGCGFALSVETTAISVHGDLVVFDAGRKAVGGDFGPPEGPDGSGEFAFIHEEHVGFRFPGGAPYRVGDRAALIPPYAPTTVNLFGAFHVAEAGHVVDVWPVLARHGDP
jgi:D-serine deaminase-like pyridoxal phosphate-dependent protein